MDRNREAFLASQDYGSEFDEDSESEKKLQKRKDLAEPQKKSRSKLPAKGEVTAEYSKDEGIRQKIQILSLDAYSRHKKFVNDYILYYNGSKKDFLRDTSSDKTDYDVIRENHRFLWTDEDGATETWEKDLAKKYWDKLFKEYCIADLSRYKENKFAMRWRIQTEVVSGKGQFICGTKACDRKEKLRSWEVNFGYVEHGVKRNALVKLRLCPECSYKLNYNKQRKEIKKRKSESSHGSSKKTKHSDKQKSEHPSGEKDDKDLRKDPEKDVTSEKKDVTADTSGTSSTEPSSVWTAPVQVEVDKSREEEFEDYFEDMFL